MEKFPSAKEIIGEAISKDPRADLNSLHSLTYRLMLSYRDAYYESRVNDFLQQSSMKKLPDETKELIKKELLKPIPVEDKSYSNFMEEVSRRISQTFQPLSGNLAELCIEKTLNDLGLQNKIHYLRKVEHTDLIMCHPRCEKPLKRHRVEVKNVALRERGTRGLKFDGDSIVGFFNEPSEFTKENIGIIDQYCRETGGFCYLPPETLHTINQRTQTDRFKSNEEFAKDMKRFIETGSI